MATKQDIDNGIAVNLAGTVPGGHSLANIRAALLRNPRGRQWVIGEVINDTTRIKHPADEPDQRTPTILFVDMAGITDPAECDQLAAMIARAHAAQPGQGRLDLDENSSDAGEPDDTTETTTRPALAAVPFNGGDDGE